MHIDTSQVIVEDLKAIGVNVTIRLEEWGRRVASGNKGDYQFAISGTPAKMLDPDWLSSYFHGSPKGYYHTPANWNFPEMDKLLDKARFTLDKEERKKLYAQWEELFLDESPEVFLVYRQTAGVRQKRVQGFKFFPGSVFVASTEGLERAWIDKSLSRKK
jgi:peptide/nickel transport system substrate-binding protein